MIDKLLKNKWLILMLVLLGVLYVIDVDKGIKASYLTLNNLKSVALILPPIFILIGLLDTWVPRETMVKYMGNKSGVIGGLIALSLGALGAGPLYVAFPVAAVLINKGARLAYVFLFLSAWVSIKLPIFMYEWTSFGGRFTMLHVISSLIVYIIGSFVMEKLLSLDTKMLIEQRSKELSA